MTEAYDAIFDEVTAFKQASLWNGGFLDCDPLVPLSWSSYTTNGFLSIYHAIYLATIRPFMPDNSLVLEIGPGHGAWTKALIRAGAGKVCALDVQSREFNGIDQWLKEDATKLEYHVVSNLSCSEVADSSVDFFWSFGAFVHMSLDVQRAYINSISRKLKSGSHGFIQYADMDIWNRVVSEPQMKIHELLSSVVGGDDGKAIRDACENCENVRARDLVAELVRTWDVVAPGRYYYIGENAMRQIVTDAGLTVLDSNLVTNLRDPLIHFRKQ